MGLNSKMKLLTHETALTCDWPEEVVQEDPKKDFLDYRVMLRLKTKSGKLRAQRLFVQCGTANNPLVVKNLKVGGRGKSTLVLGYPRDGEDRMLVMGIDDYCRKLFPVKWKDGENRRNYTYNTLLQADGSLRCKIHPVETIITDD